MFIFLCLSISARHCLRVVEADALRRSVGGDERDRAVAQARRDSRKRLSISVGETRELQEAARRRSVEKPATVIQNELECTQKKIEFILFLNFFLLH